jgi:hypothetical protein
VVDGLEGPYVECGALAATVGSLPDTIKVTGTNSWDPQRCHSTIRLSNLNTEVTYPSSTGRNALVMATHGFSTGCHYWETTIKKWDGGGNGYNFIGVVLGSRTTESVDGGNAGQGIWAVQLGDSLKRFKDGESKTDWKSCNFKTGTKVGLYLDQDQHTLDIYIDKVWIGQAFKALPDAVLFPVLGVGCLSPNVYVTDFAAADPPPRSGHIAHPKPNTLSIGATLIFQPKGDLKSKQQKQELGYPSPGSNVIFVREGGAAPKQVFGVDKVEATPLSCMVRLPNSASAVNVPYNELVLPLSKRTNKKAGIKTQLREMVKWMTSKDAERVVEVLITRSSKETLQLLVADGTLLRAAVHQCVLVLDSLRERFRLNKRLDRIRHIQRVALRGLRPLTPDETICLSLESATVTLLSDLPAPFQVEIPSDPGMHYTFKSQVTYAARANLDLVGDLGSGGWSSAPTSSFVAEEPRGWMSCFDRCIRIESRKSHTLLNNLAVKYHETDGDFHSALGHPATAASGGVHTFTFYLDSMRNSNIGLTTSDLNLKKSPSSFDHKFAIVFWKSGTFFVRTAESNGTESNVKSIETGDTVVMSVDRRQGADGPTPCVISVKGKVVHSFANLHDVGLPLGADIHAYTNLDYTDEKISLTHTHTEFMPDGDTPLADMSVAALKVLGSSSSTHTWPKLIDGDGGTYWQSNGSSKPHWICLGLPATFDQLFILLEEWGSGYVSSVLSHVMLPLLSFPIAGLKPAYVVIQ